MPHTDTLHKHRGEPSQGAALSSRTSHWQVHSAGRSSYDSQTPVVQEDKELRRATEPGQRQRKAKVKQGGRQPAGFSSPSFFHTHGNARNPEGKQGCHSSSTYSYCEMCEADLSGGRKEETSTNSAPGSQVLFSGLEIKTMFTGSARLRESLAH